MCISGSGGAGEYCAFSSRTTRATHSAVELVALAQAVALSACRRRPPHLAALVDWFGGPLGVRVSSDGFMEWINEDNLKEFVCSIFSTPIGIQDPQSPTVALKVNHSLQ